MSAAREKQIFLAALDCASAGDRAACISAACGGDAELQQAVEKLLAADERAGGELQTSGGAPAARLKERLDAAAVAFGLDWSTAGMREAGESIPDRTGEQIGPYRLMEKLGEGGFGEVYVAEQQQPLRRRVALKLLKPGMDSRDVIARFEAERQALALMDHPHIARVLDAGSTSVGQPYFVMELVRGLPINRYCEQYDLDVPARLELFIDVCQAVQHAHQKGVIHRDIKPTNILVTRHDTEAVVKVIDFGVAKAVGDPLTEKTLYTRLAQMIGTPAYMSPEQAEMNSLDVDTRSDIYSLGVVLYELLTGVTPFEQRRLQTASFDEMRRIIREEEPPRPSVRLTTRLQVETTAGAQRSSDVRVRSRALRGDLDWIVLKALEKDRRRRYETAADFARDVRQYLNQQPVAARPPSLAYRVSRFARRNKVAFATTVFVLLSLVSGTVVSTWQAIEANHARADADAARRDAEEFADRLKAANVLLDSARANADEGRWSTAWSQYTKATELQPEHYLTWSGRGSLAARLGAWRAAAADYARALQLGAHANNPGWWGVPQLCLYAGEEEAYRLAAESLQKQVSSTQDPASLALIVRSLSLKPLPAEQARALAERIDETSRHHTAPDRRRMPPPDGPPAQRPRPETPDRGGPPDRAGPPPMRMWPPVELQWYAAGLAHYRAGNDQLALERIQAVQANDSEMPSVHAVLPLAALTHWRMGDAQAAEESLAQAEAVLADWTVRLSEGPPPQLPLPWFDFLEFVLLYREAHQQIRGSAAPADERMTAIESQAMSMLQGE